MTRRDPWPLAVGVVAVATLLAGAGVLGLRAADSVTTLSDDDAVTAFRSGPSPSPTGPTGPPAAGPAATPTPGPAAVAVAGGPSAGPPAPGSAAPAAPGSPAPAVATRSSPAPGPASQPSAPPPGVYRYATEGFEQVDALGGSRHDYPDRSTITSSPSGCGTQDSWKPLEERVGVTVQCPGREGLELRETFQEREFFGRSQSQRLRCEPGVLVLPSSPRAGQTWRGSCTSGDTQAAIAGRVVGLERLRVGATDVPVVRVLLEATLTGATRGRSDRELWLRRDGLLVQARGSTDTDADTDAGQVRYEETYWLELLSLEPLR